MEFGELLIKYLVIFPKKTIGCVLSQMVDFHGFPKNPYVDHGINLLSIGHSLKKSNHSGS